MRSLVMSSADGLWLQTRSRSAPYSSSILPRPLVKAPRPERDDTPPSSEEIPTLIPPADCVDE
ncbi:MAG TPA: hypothetical protein VHO25_19005, partial [Polyangiaceae bacterium]|nr:hypothetical protein [Polyangiaceae bacterium]